MPGTQFIDLGKIKGWVDLRATQWFKNGTPGLGIQCLNHEVIAPSTSMLGLIFSFFFLTVLCPIYWKRSRPWEWGWYFKVIEAWDLFILLCTKLLLLPNSQPLNRSSCLQLFYRIFPWNISQKKRLWHSSLWKPVKTSPSELCDYGAIVYYNEDHIVEKDNVFCGWVNYR